METAQNKLIKDNMRQDPVTLTIFSDRITCAYCQEVAFRASPIQNSKYLFYPGHITTPLKLLLDGGPYYESENVDHDMVLRILARLK
jgi:hypothetical protein